MISEFFGRLFNRAEGKTRVRSLDAAGGGRRFAGAGQVVNLNSDIYAGAHNIRSRAQHLSRNNPWVASGVNAFVGSAVGCGVEPTPRTEDAALRRLIASRWAEWVDEADLSGQLDFAGILAGVARGCIESGESFVRLITTDEGLKLQPLAPSMCPLDLHQNLERGRVRAGIEFDRLGRKTAIHVYANEPGDPLEALNLTPIRVPVDDVCHVFEQLTPGQIRGLSRLAPVLLRALDLDGYEDATLLRAKIANMMTGFISETDGGITDDVVNNELSFEPGALVNLPPGATIDFSNPPDPAATYPDFVRFHLRAIASGLGVTYEQISSDFSSTNYSSARAALIEHRRKIEQFQYLTLVPLFLNKTWKRWVAVETLMGNLPADAAGVGADWLMPRFQSADEKATVESEKLEIELGLKSRAQAVAERGWRVEDLDASIAADRQREAALGLTFGEQPAAAQPTQPEAAKPADQPVDVNRAVAEALQIRSFIDTWGQK
jgi:lambda family phage portal protein